jgi:LCP family protein required for cell wall assembly
LEKNEKVKTNNKKSKKYTILKTLLILILIALLGIIGYFVYGTIKNGGGTQGLISTVVGQTQEELENLEPFSALLLGSSQNMTDTIMIFKYNPQTQNAYLISIPRDTFIGNNKNSARAADKINSVYKGKYPEKIVAAVNKVTGLNLEYYVLVDTQALKALVDTIGGVYFDVPIDMKYTDKKQGLYINLKAGYQLLDGNKAEQVVRFRHNQDGSSYSYEYGNNDTGRMKTQRNFLKAVIKQTLTPSNILNIGKFIDIAQTYVKTNIPMDVLKNYIAPAVDFSVDNLETGTLPGVNEKCNGVWIFVANKTKTAKYLTEMNNKLAGLDDVSKEELSNLKIEILNGSGSSSKLKEVKKILTDAGFTISSTATINSTEKTSLINKSEVNESILTSIQILLETGNISSSTAESEIDITIILGKDFE